jgi:UDP-N-acetylglucosamine acyltransferase
MKLYGLNAVGLQRHGFSPEAVAELKKAYRLFFRSGLNISQALDRARTELAQLPEVTSFLQFVEESGRGVLV